MLQDPLLSSNSRVMSGHRVTNGTVEWLVHVMEITWRDSVGTHWNFAHHVDPIIQYKEASQWTSHIALCN